MKREGGEHNAFSKATKAGHMEKDMKHVRESDLKYGKNNMDNEKELRESVDKLSGYVKKHRMKY
jgi:hypothetical protein